MTTLQIPRFGARPVSAVFTVSALQPAAPAPVAKVWEGWPPTGQRFALKSGRVVSVVKHLRGGCVEYEYEDGERVGLTLAFLRKHGVPSGWSCKGGEHGRPG